MSVSNVTGYYVLNNRGSICGRSRNFSLFAASFRPPLGHTAQYNPWDQIKRYDNFFLNIAALQKLVPCITILLRSTPISDVQSLLHVVVSPVWDGRATGWLALCLDLTTDRGVRLPCKHGGMKVRPWHCKVSGQLWVLRAVTSSGATLTETSFPFLFSDWTVN
jgi:hypothetical protein